MSSILSVITPCAHSFQLAIKRDFSPPTSSPAPSPVLNGFQSKSIREIQEIEITEVTEVIRRLEVTAEADEVVEVIRNLREEAHSKDLECDKLKERLQTMEKRVRILRLRAPYRNVPLSDLTARKLIACRRVIMRCWRILNFMPADYGFSQ